MSRVEVEVTDSDETTSRATLPYLSFATFKNFVDTLSNGRPLPPRIDRSLMLGMAGGTQTLLLGTLTTFGLISEDKDVSPRFLELVSMPEDQRPAMVAQMVRETYAAPLELAANHATADQLQESFRELTGYQGSTLRKSISFFLNMAKYADVPLSPYFKAPSQNRTTGTRTRPARRTKPAPVEELPTVGPAPTVGESQTIELASGGTVTVSCSTAFLSLSREDRQFVFGLVDRLIDYREQSLANPARVATDGTED